MVSLQAWKTSTFQFNILQQWLWRHAAKLWTVIVLMSFQTIRAHDIRTIVTNRCQENPWMRVYCDAIPDSLTREDNPLTVHFSSLGIATVPRILSVHVRQALRSSTACLSLSNNIEHWTWCICPWCHQRNNATKFPRFSMYRDAGTSPIYTPSSW